MVDYERLDRAINARRLDLGLSWLELATAAGVSDVSLRNFRKGRGTPRDLNKRRLEQALRWAPGSWDAILAGGNATPAGGPAQEILEVQAERDALADSLAELESMGATRTAAYKLLTERLQQLDHQISRPQTADRLGETGT